jgi:aminoglycoside 3-N-acetyltransferase
MINGSMSSPLSITSLFSADRVLSDVGQICEQTRWQTTPEISKAARLIAQKLRNASKLIEVQLHHLPADGKSSFGGWKMPKGWSVQEGYLEFADSHLKATRIADYHQNPWSLAMYSPSTPRPGLVAEVVHLPDPNEKKSIRGKIVLLDPGFRRIYQVGPKLIKRGAVAIIADDVGEIPGIKEGDYLLKATGYYNSLNSPWDAPRLPSFILTPEKGKMLRALLKKQKVLLRAVVRSRLYNGTLPLVSALLPGSSHEQIVITAHMDEPGASDNASGTAVAMELLRAAAQLVEKRKTPLRRGLRLFLSWEVRGLQAFINTRKVRGKFLGGLNLDMVGCDHREGKTQLDVFGMQPLGPSYIDSLLQSIIWKERRRSPQWKCRFRQHMIVDDLHFSTYPFNVPMTFLGQAPDRTYHTSLDRPECLSKPHIEKMGIVLSQAVEFMTDTGYREPYKLAKKIFEEARKALRKNDRSASDIVHFARKKWTGLIPLVPYGPTAPNENEVKEMRRKKLFIKGHLYPRAAFQLKLEEWNRILSKGVKIPRAIMPSDATERRLQQLVPLKLFAGYLGWNDLSVEQVRELKNFPHLVKGWGVPPWVQATVDLSNGKRTAWDIYRMLNTPKNGATAVVMLKLLQFLEKNRKIRFRKILEKSDILQACKRLGIREGDVLMAHTSISNFGYITGGANTLIDALLEVVGKHGTLIMPTHTSNWVGNPPYDPKRSPSLVGATTNLFLKRKDVIRSLHPTHSVAATGPMARMLVESHDHRVPPQGNDGFWGNFVRADGKVLMFCRLGSNTLLHAGELWGGVPYPPGYVHYIENGKRKEIAMQGMPLHVNGFRKAHASLKRRGLLKSVRIGEGRIHFMPARAAVETTMKYVKKDPLLATKKGCECRYCEHVRREVARLKKIRRTKA